RFRGGRATQKLAQTPNSGGQSLDHELSPSWASGSWTSGGCDETGGCERTVLLGKDKHVVKLSWRLVSERGVLVTATLVDSKHKNRSSQTCSGFAKNSEEVSAKRPKS
ncbi:unnamed protein product, partial [Ectocarpus sp. 13 AM-2016]